MSVGDLKTDGLKGNNFPWQLKMLNGQQCACDYLQAIDLNTDDIEPLLLQILLAIQSGQDYEAMLVVDANDITWLEIRVYNPDTGTFDPPVYYLPGSNTPGTPLAPLTYINPNTYLASIVSNTTAIATNTGDTVTELVDLQAFYTAGPQGCPDSLSTTLCTEQANVAILPGINNVVGYKDMNYFVLAAGGRLLLSFSIYNQDTTVSILVSTDAGSSFFSVPPGVTINYDAGGLVNYFEPTQIVIDQNAATAYPLVTFTCI